MNSNDILKESPEDLKRVQRRYGADKRFRLYSVSALIVAAAFLVIFLVDIVGTGHTAFLQAKINVDIHYTEEAKEIPYAAVQDEDARYLISRGFYRLIPGTIEANPEMVDTVENKWVLATADVDQYLKGKPNRLKSREKKIVDEMMQTGQVDLKFNTGFFMNGDSKIPELAGIKSAAIGTIYVMIITMLFSVPIGIMTAIYLEEFAPNNLLTQTIEVNINNLAAIPSIIFGLLGLAIFINFFGVPRSSAMAGGLTLGLMNLPIIIISSRAALRSVPDSIRQGAQGVGSSPWQVVWHHVLPLSLPGILTGTIIGLAQAMGETAPLLIVGMLAYIPDAPTGFMDAATVMPAQIFTWAGDSQRPYVERTAAGIMMLLVVLLSLNAFAVWVRNRHERKW